ncbi:MAG: hypothetical protein ACK5NA_03405 [Enterococcus sp.]
MKLANRWLYFSHLISACLAIYFGVLYLNQPINGFEVTDNGIMTIINEGVTLSLFLFVILGVGNVFACVANYFRLYSAPILSCILSILGIIVVDASSSALTATLLAYVLFYSSQFLSGVYLLYVRRSLFTKKYD